MIFRLLEKAKCIVVTLRFSILSIFVALFVSTMIMILVIAHIRYVNALSYVSLLLMDHASTAVLKEVNAGIKPATIETKFTVNLFNEGVLKNNSQQLISYTHHLVMSAPLIQRATWCSATGDYVYSEKKPDHAIETAIYEKSKPNIITTISRDKQGNIIKRTTSSPATDPCKLSWYEQAKSAGNFIWTDTYLIAANTLGITAAAPVKNQANHIEGVFALDISLNYLSEFLSKQVISPHGFSFIVTENENLIAFPLRKPFTDLPIKPYQLLNIHITSLPLIDKTLDIYKSTGLEEMTFNFGGETYLISYKSIPDLEQYGWLIGIAIPVSDFVMPLQKMYVFTLIISLIILTIGMLLISSLVSRIVKPINLLAKETENIKNFDLEEEIIIQSRIKEIIYLNNAIHSMKSGLKSFQKYVPKILVRQLIESGEDIRVGGTRKQLTILFSDIENFTTIAEITDPDELMIQLCEYFENLSQIIILEKGIIDKYIGDSIMSFWGAPLPEEKPNYYAARAVLRCEKKLTELNNKWLKEGKPQLLTRFGIHAGEAIVGNLGSSERLNYTALGDTINISSRLEKINKIYQTKIIVSEQVYADIKDEFILRKIDCVALKGRTKSIFLYELLSDDINEIPFDIVAYRDMFDAGFNAYRQKRWDEAIAAFKACYQIYSTDTLAPIFIERCRAFKIKPPAPDWNGTTKIKE